MLPGDPRAEKARVDCDEHNTSNPVCLVVEPNVFFDGRYVVPDTRTFVTDGNLDMRENADADTTAPVITLNGEVSITPRVYDG